MLKLLSSNESKLREFNLYGMPVALEKGRDIREVLSDDVTVVLYKALEAGVNCIVEDTSLDIEDSDIGVDIKYRMSELGNYIGHRATATVLIAHNTGTHINVYRGVTYGKITPPRETADEVFGFDNYFTPYNSLYNFFELKAEPSLWTRLPRYRAVRNFKENHIFRQVSIKDIPVWTGEYQID